MLISISKNILLPCLLSLLLLNGCLTSDQPTSAEFEQVGQGYIHPTQKTLSGEVLHKTFASGQITITAHSSFPCSQGRCPVIDKDPLSKTQLDQPGTFTLPLNDLENNLILIATYETQEGKVRIAHQLIEDIHQLSQPIILSLNRPHQALR